MTVKERLKIFAKSQEKSVRAFEKEAGLGYGYVNAIRVSIQPDKIKSIALHYPQLNLDWLLTGKGEMINKSDSLDEKVAGKVITATKTEASTEGNMNSDYKNLIETIRFLSETVNSQQRTIEQLQVEVKKLSVPKEGNVGCADVG
jgi:hypothetical protein